MEIFLHIDGENTGPHTTYAVRDLLRSGKIDADTMAWMKGMAEWVPLRDFEPMREDAQLRVADAGLAEISVSDEERAAAIHAALHPDRPRPWIRFWARFIDIVIFTTGILWFVDAASLADPKDLVAYPVPTKASIVFTLAVPLAWIFVESTLLLYLRTTPGKWLLNIKLRRSDGGALELGQAWRRSFSVWWRGWGIGLMPLMLIGFALASLSLTAHNKTTWDIREDLEVEHGPINELRVIGAVAVLVAATLVTVAVAGMPVPPEK